MAIFPGAIYKPITAAKGRKALAEYNRVNLHVAVSEAASLHPAFNKTGKVDCHLYVLKNGNVEQYVDTAFQAFADLDGNDATISVETQGGVNDANGEPWTAAQVATLARIYKWAIETHGIKARLASDSRVGDSSKGLSWHRLGCDGNFPALPSVLAGRGQRGGGMHYSKSRGKICPGDAKILQIPEIFALATAGATLVTSPAPAPSIPAPIPAPVARNRFGRPMLRVDGYLAGDTIGEWQAQMGTPVDREISTGKGGSSLVRAVQRKLLAAGHSIGPAGADGFGISSNNTKRTPKTRTVEALQRYLGTSPDGVLSSPSDAIKALQRALNAGNF